MSDWSHISPGDLDPNLQGLNRYMVDLPYHWDGCDSILSLPVVVAHSGPGKCALLAGDTHDDEFEGQIAG